MLPDMQLALRLGAAALLGSLIGFERERLLWAAGLRTHMLVCVGSCLVMVVSAYGFNGVLGRYVVLDPSRMAAQVITGVGFLGAGSIILRNEVVKGLTTAASLWAVAAVGLAVGGGLYLAAVMTTVIILVILAGMKPIEEIYRARMQSCVVEVTAERGAIGADKIKKLTGLRANQIRRIVIEDAETGPGQKVEIALARVSSEDISRGVDRLRRGAGVHGVDVVPRRRDKVPQIA